ncbi:MAG: nucleotidyltransferase family protein [Patescibacteria group bacterium]
MTLEEIKNRVIPILKPYGVSRVGLFGSAVRGEMRKDSDIDILVDMNKNISLFEFVGIKQKLEARLGRKVDLVEYHTLKPALKDKILQNQVVLL